MYRVAIIDDEPIIVRGLQKIIKWEDLQCEVVTTADNGVDGLKVIRQFRPNILLTDISMPQMDGLTMIAAVKSEFPQMEVSILTGFRDFDYAQQAICLGVTRFLLKPSKMEELQEAVRVMIENLKSRDILPDHSDHQIPEQEESTAEPLTEGALELEASHEEGNQTDETLDSAASSFIVKNAMRYIEENYKERLKLSDVADHVYVSQWHLSKLLNRHAEQNFSEILNNVRMEHAKELLKDPSLRIGDVAEEVGFLDMAHFSRVFKKQVGVSANEYRNTIL